MLFRLVYYSTNLIRKSSNPRRSELRKIVLSAGTNNRAMGITGGLMSTATTSARSSRARGLRFQTFSAGLPRIRVIAPS